MEADEEGEGGIEWSQPEDDERDHREDDKRGGIQRQNIRPSDVDQGEVIAMDRPHNETRQGTRHQARSVRDV